MRGVLVVGGGDVGIELGAELRVAAPDGQHVGIEDLRPARLLPELEAVGLGAHHAGHGPELDPAAEQLGRRLVAGQGEEAADVGAPGRHPAQAHRQALADRRLQAVEAPVGRRVAAPDDLRAARGAAPARPVEARERLHAVAAGERVCRAVVAGGVGVVAGLAGAAVGAPGVGRRVLAEVLHPAVVAVVDRLLQQVAVEVDRLRVREVHLPDQELRAARVAVQVGLAERVPRQQAAVRRLLEARVLALADHRVEVGGDRQAGVVELLHARALGVGLAGLVGAGQVVGVGLRDGRGRVGVAQCLEVGVVAVLGLPPGAEVERRGRPGLAALALGHAGDDLPGRRAREHAQGQGARVRADRPRVGTLSGQVEVGVLVVVDQYAVSARRHEPGDREVGGIVPRRVALGRDEGGDSGALLRQVGTVADEVLDVVAALVDGVGALAEAQVALGGVGVEGRAGGGGAGRPVDGGRRLDDAVAVAADAQR